MRSHKFNREAARERADRLWRVLANGRTAEGVGDRIGTVRVRNRAVLRRFEVGYHEIVRERAAPNAWRAGVQEEWRTVILGTGTTWDEAFADALAKRRQDQ